MGTIIICMPLRRAPFGAGFSEVRPNHIVYCDSMACAPTPSSSTCMCESARACPCSYRISRASSYDAEHIPHARAGLACKETRSGRWRWQGQRRGPQHGSERGSEVEDASFKSSGLLGAEKADGPKLSSLPGGGIASHPAGEKDHPSLRR